MHQIPHKTPVLKCEFNKAAMHGHSLVKFTAYLSEHIFIRTPLEDCFQHNKRNSVNMSMNHIVKTLDNVKRFIF